MMNITFAIGLLLVLQSQQHCQTQVGCFRYNCADFTADGVSILRANGFPAVPACGFTAHNYHTWIKIGDYHIEPQGAVLIHPSTINDYAPSSSVYFFTRTCVVRGIV